MNEPSSRPLPATLLALLALPAGGCLETSPPQLTVPAHSAPFLVGGTAEPPLGEVVVLDLDSQTGVQFGADVISQDDPSGSTGPFQTVSAKLYVDYGVSPPGTQQPFLGEPFPGNDELENGTLAQTSGRFISATWIPEDLTPALGCHTATLVASHLFDENPGCPRCDDDIGTLTWMVLACRSSLGDCGVLPLHAVTNGLAPCPVPTTTCDEADPPANRMCPEAAGGGAP